MKGGPVWRHATLIATAARAVAADRSPARQRRAGNYRRVMRLLAMVRTLAAALKRRPRLRRTLEAAAALAVIGACAYAVKDEWSKAEPQLANARLGDVGLALG